MIQSILKNSIKNKNDNTVKPESKVRKENDKQDIRSKCWESVGEDSKDEQEKGRQIIRHCGVDKRLF